MDLNITRADIDKYRSIIKNNKPYDENDPILSTFDAECDRDRMQATTARRLLESFGIDPNDPNDYGNITD
jgi:hypothetical protein